MSRTLPLIAILTLIAPPVLACTMPDPQEVAAERDPLFDGLKSAKSEAAGQALAREIWTLFSTAPDATAQDLLDRGVRYIERGQFESAEAMLGELIAYCPDYAEGWNQRAFARFLQRDFEGALADIDRTLDIEPRHFGALAGRGLTFLSQGRETLAHKAIRDGLAVHPWLGERRFLPPEEKI